MSAAETSFDVAIVGGGIAGLAAAHALAPGRRVCLLEREPTLAAHASGRNAAILRPLEHDSSTAALTSATLAVLGELVDPTPLRSTGLWLCAATLDALGGLIDVAHRDAVRFEHVAGAKLVERLPIVARGEVQHGLWLPAGGVFDIHALTSVLAARARADGAVLRTGVEVAGIEVEAGRVQGLRLCDGTRVSCEHVVLASGAWSAALGAAAGAPLPLQPLRRHLVQLTVHESLPAEHPVVWRVDDELYFRPETGGVLVSPCDATPSEPVSEPPTDARELERLSDKLIRTAPQLAEARVRSRWACLRTFAPDRELTVGPDPRVAGLHWLAGLGGRGMGVAIGATSILCAGLDDRPHPLRNALDPARLLS